MVRLPSSSTPRDDAHDDTDLLAMLDALWRRRTMIAAITAAIFALGLLYAWLARPVYETSLLVRVESNSDNTGSQLLGNLSSLLGVKSSDAAEMEMLRSRHVIGEAVDRTHYDILARPARFPLIGWWIADGSTTLSAPGLLGRGGYAWGNESLTVDSFQTPAPLYDEKFTLVVLDAQRYSLTVKGLQKPCIGSVGQTTTLRTAAGDVALHVAAIHALPGTRFELYRHSRQQTITELQQRLSVLDKAKDAGVIAISLQGAHPQRIAGLVTALGSAYVRQNGEQKSMQAEKSLAFLQQQLPGMKKQLRDAEDALLAYRTAHNAIDLSEEGKLQMGEAVALQTRISLLQQERQSKLEQLTPRHPDVVAIDAQIALLQNQIHTIDARIRQLPDTEQDVLRLTRDVRVNNDLYVAMLNSMQQMRLLRAGNVASVSIVDHAELPEQPIKPRRVLIAAGALLLGLFLGVCAALLRYLWRGSITDPHDIERFLDVPVEATIPLSRSQRRWDAPGWRRLRKRFTACRPLALAQPNEPAMEGLRSLSVAVQLSAAESNVVTVLLTGPTQGVGKSFVAVNLATLLARAGKRVLLVDGDLRKGTLHRSLGANEHPGLATVLRGQTSLSLAIQPTRVDRLWLLSTGCKSGDTADLLHGDGLRHCMSKAAAMFDIVLVDSAPLLPVADTLSLAQLADAVYAVVRYGATSEGELLETHARLARAGIPLDGVVLNAVQMSLQGMRYGQYGHGGYPADNGATAQTGTPT